MQNKVFIVTDATSEIGKVLALDLAKSGGTLVLVARDVDLGNAVHDEIARTVSNPSLDLQLCDVSILSSVRNLAEILKSRYETIDVLINNAAIRRRKRTVTVDGFEEMFAANHLGPFLLTNLLLEPLQAAVQARGSARILNIIEPSTAPLQFDDLQSEKDFSAANAFHTSQTAALLFTFELARRLANTGITVNAIHPGAGKKGFNLKRFFTWTTSPEPQKASSGALPEALTPELEKTTGKYLHDGREVEVPAYAHDRAAQQRLWEVSETLTGLAANKGVTPINDPHL